MFSRFSAQEPKELLNIIKGVGSASIGTDSDGDPIISASFHGVKFRVLFYGYNNGRSESAQFVASWDAGGDGPTTREANEFHKQFRFAKIYIDDDGDPMLVMDVHLPENGSKEFLEQVLKSWLFSIASYIKKFSGR